MIAGDRGATGERAEQLCSGAVIFAQLAEVGRAAVEFYDTALEEPDSGLEYLESHGVDRARLATVACLLYGNAPNNHGRSLARGIGPAERAPRSASSSPNDWELAIKNHTKGSAAAPAVPPAARQRRWLSRRLAGA